MMTRADIEKEFRRQGINFDMLPYSAQESLVETRMRELNETESSAPPPSHQPVVGSRFKRIGDLPAPAATTPSPPVPLRFGAAVQTLPVSDADELRLQLKRAIDSLRAATDQVQQAQQAADKAATAVKVSKQNLQRFAGLDETVLQHRYEGLTNNLLPPNLPIKLQEQLDLRVLAQTHHDSVTKLKRHAAAELATAEQRAADATAAMSQVVNAIAVLHARQLVAELEAAEQHTYALRCKILALQITLPGDIVRRARAPLPNVTANQADKDAWSEFLRRLRTDPDAQLDV